MSVLTELVDTLPLDDLARHLDCSPEAAEQLAAPTLACLLAGVAQNAQDPSLEQQTNTALQQHAGSPLSRGQVDLAGVNTAEGAVVVEKIFGRQVKPVAKLLAQDLDLPRSVVAKALPLLAPVLLAQLGRRLQATPTGNLLEQAEAPEQAGQDGRPDGDDVASVHTGILAGVLAQLLGDSLGGLAAPDFNPWDSTNAQFFSQKAAARRVDIVTQLSQGLFH